VIARTNLYLTRDKQAIVAGGHPDAMFLFIREGEEIPAVWAERYGITEDSNEELDDGSST